jgi:hypothetical protein
MSRALVRKLVVAQLVCVSYTLISYNICYSALLQLTSGLVSSLQMFRLTFCMSLSSPLCVLHASPMSSSNLIISG